MGGARGAAKRAGDDSLLADHPLSSSQLLAHVFLGNSNHYPGVHFGDKCALRLGYVVFEDTHSCSCMCSWATAIITQAVRIEDRRAAAGFSFLHAWACLSPSFRATEAPPT